MDPAYLARPGQSLGRHLDGVAHNAEALIPADATTPSGNSLRRLVETVAHLHDVGKLTSAFQRYIRSKPDRSSRPSEYHAATGAILTYHALAKQGFSSLESAAGFYAVLQHHGAIPDIEHRHTSWTTRGHRYADVQPKLVDIDSTASSAADQRLRAGSNGELGWADVFVQDPERYRSALASFQIEPTFYPLLLRVWSTLTCADKLDVAGAPISGDIHCPDPDRIQFRNTATGVRAQLNEHRTHAREDVCTRLRAADDTGVFTLTLPTGFGKTVAGLEAALKRAHRQDGRVVYALPYTTVLDQIDAEIQSRFDVSPASAQYTLHHHLADTRTHIETSSTSITDRTEAVYGESWQAGLVLTTFVQLLESLAGPANLQSMKLPALQNAVIILDEPQTLPRPWWHLISRLASVLVDEYNATVILMTATQPRFLAAYDVNLSPVELVEKPQQYFEFLRRNPRVTFQLDASLGLTGTTEAIHPATAASRILNRTVTDGGSTLSVNNTVANAGHVSRAVGAEAEQQNISVLDLGRTLASFIDRNGAKLLAATSGDGDLALLANRVLERITLSNDVGLVTATLTAALRPADRALLIEMIRSILDEDIGTPIDTVPLIVTSTQLVEAGVDVSFDRVYRDFAPVPSLVQAAGRCNRSFTNDQGEVVIWRLASADGTRLPSEAVYTRRGDLLQPASGALRSVVKRTGTNIPEAEMVSAVTEAYYRRLHETDHTIDRSNQLVQAYDCAQGDLLRGQSLIEDGTEDAIVLVTDADMSVLARYLRARGDGYHAAKAAARPLQYLLASAPEEDIGAMETTEAVVAQAEPSTTAAPPFPIIDARTDGVYSIENGLGLRQL